MSSIIPPRKPPFLEISADDAEGYKYAIRWRDERYRSMVIWRGKSRKATVARAAAFEPSFGVPVVDLSARSR